MYVLEEKGFLVQIQLLDISWSSYSDRVLFLGRCILSRKRHSLTSFPFSLNVCMYQLFCFERKLNAQIFLLVTYLAHVNVIMKMKNNMCSFRTIIRDN